MAGRTLTVSLWLPDREIAVLDRRVAEMREIAQRQIITADWSEEDELRSLLMLAIFRLRQCYELRDRRRESAEEIPAPGIAEPPPWLRDLEITAE